MSIFKVGLTSLFDRRSRCIKLSLFDQGGSQTITI